jgi:uncharacterized phiE125 gp8 family phage protein
MTVTQTTPPAYQPLTLTEVKLHLRVDGTDEDTLLPILIGAAVDTCQQLTGRSIMAQGWRLTLNGWADAVRLPYPEISAVASIKYFDEDGAQQTLDPSTYELIGDTVHKTSGATYPELWKGPGVVEINYTAGYSAGNEAAQQAAIPAGIKAWLLLTIGTLYANRESVQTGVSVAALPDRFTDSLLDRFKVY